MNNLYEILGVPNNATQEHIKKAYRDLAKVHHPDKGGSKDTFSRIQMAYDVLSDEERRAKYDQTGSIEKERGFEERFLGFVASQIIPIIENAEDVNFDLMKEAKKHINKLIKIGNENIEELEKKSKHIEAAILKCKRKNEGENVISSILNSKLKNIQSVIQQVLDEKEFIEKCLIMIEDYDYDFTEMIEGEGGGYKSWAQRFSKRDLKGEHVHFDFDNFDFGDVFGRGNVKE